VVFHKRLRIGSPQGTTFIREKPVPLNIDLELAPAADYRYLMLHIDIR